eukprot:CAMPEP_0170144468 /NCGR_PEP_ID=MMETSP0033_2-20121228/13789_1 /TAXON_ID=195969 /ORGANISM="Dolichomastix tenuilepis, Strain CCMP3274" /LENGTH=95 /DNA_ID=CAMNT_0010380969 /DNA_START=574 /DNA_END=858 /DNA_ORIENTATION=-
MSSSARYPYRSACSLHGGLNWRRERRPTRPSARLLVERQHLYATSSALPSALTRVSNAIGVPHASAPHRHVHKSGWNKNSGGGERGARSDRGRGG